MIQADTLKPGWKLVKFGDVVRLSKERAAKSEIESIERYVGLEHIDPEDLRIRRWGLVAEGITFTSKFKPGQVLFGKRRAYQRKVAVADFEGVCSGDIYVFESADPKVLLPELLPFICQTDRFFEYAVGTSAGSLSPRTNWTSLAKFEFALPVLKEQNRIAELLNTAKEVRHRTQNFSDAGWKVRIASYYTITQRGKYSGELINSVIGKIPPQWSVMPVGQAVKIENRFRKPINAEERAKMQGLYPYFGPTGQLDSINEYRLDGKYALIGEDGDHFLKHSVWAMTQIISGRFNVNNHAHIIQGTDLCLTEWFFHYFRHRDLYQWLTKQGSGRLKLKKADLEMIPIALPPLEEQYELVHLLDNIANSTGSISQRVQNANFTLNKLSRELLGS